MSKKIFSYGILLGIGLFLAACTKIEDKYEDRLAGTWHFTKANKKSVYGDDVLHRWQGLEWTFGPNRTMIWTDKDAGTVDTGNYFFEEHRVEEEDGSLTKQLYLTCDIKDTDSTHFQKSFFITAIRKEVMRLIEMHEDPKNDILLKLEKK